MKHLALALCLAACTHQRSLRDVSSLNGSQVTIRTTTWPVAASLGLRAGAIYDSTPGVGLRFGLSPVATFELILAKHLLVGLQGSFDIPLAGNGSSLRIGLNVGWRF